MTSFDGEDRAGGGHVGVEADVAGGAEVGRDANALENSAEREEVIDGLVGCAARQRDVEEKTKAVHTEVVGAGLDGLRAGSAQTGLEELDVVLFILGELLNALVDETRVASALDCARFALTKR